MLMGMGILGMGRRIRLYLLKGVSKNLWREFKPSQSYLRDWQRKEPAQESEKGQPEVSEKNQKNVAVKVGIVSCLEYY